MLLDEDEDIEELSEEEEASLLSMLDKALSAENDEE